MYKRSILIYLTLALTAISLSGCEGTSSSSEVGVVVNESKTLADSESTEYQLSKGSYTIKITASRTVVNIRWVGSSNCGAADGVFSYQLTCDVYAEAQLVVSNPIGGGDLVVTVKITRH